MTQVRQRVFSGVQPTGKIHIGNYIGALSLWAENQAQYDNLFCVVDLHALTIPGAISPSELHAKSRETAALYVACGIDPQQSVIFVQSRVSAHAELAWVLNCVTPLGWLQRMTQFKAKSENQESVGTGLLDYPVLQAADILLYDAEWVPVGEDQRQHIELTRDIAIRFNHLYGDTLKSPQPLIRKSGARVMAFDEPESKMSKSVGAVKAGHSVGLVDPPDLIRKTIMRAATDSGNNVQFSEASPGVLNLLTLFEVLTRRSRPDIEAEFEGRGYGTLKKAVAEQVIESLEPIQRRYHELMDDRVTLEEMLDDGAERAQVIAEATLEKVKRTTGLG
jgi:tryptophanyl-tRNA synthetase